MSARVEAAAKAWVARHSQPGSWTLEQNLDAALSAADQIMFSEAAIERAAETLYMSGIGGDDKHWDDIGRMRQSYFRHRARQVVAALREEA
jgi:hypothetical protein